MRQESQSEIVGSKTKRKLKDAIDSHTYADHTLLCILLQLPKPMDRMQVKLQ